MASQIILRKIFDALSPIKFRDLRDVTRRECEARATAAASALVGSIGVQP